MAGGQYPLNARLRCCIYRAPRFHFTANGRDADTPPTIEKLRNSASGGLFAFCFQIFYDFAILISIYRYRKLSRSRQFQPDSSGSTYKVEALNATTIHGSHDFSQGLRLAIYYAKIFTAEAGQRLPAGAIAKITIQLKSSDEASIL